MRCDRYEDILVVFKGESVRQRHSQEHKNPPSLPKKSVRRNFLGVVKTRLVDLV